MLFKEYHIPMIRSGSKTVTRREWDEDYAGPRVGSVQAAKTDLFTPNDQIDCWIKITRRYQQPLGEMSDRDARKEGDYESVEEFREGYEAVYGEDSWDPQKVVDVVEFEYVGKTRQEEVTAVTDGGIDVSDEMRRCAHCEEQSRPIVERRSRSMIVVRCPLCRGVEEIPLP